MTRSKPAIIFIFITLFLDAASLINEITLHSFPGGGNSIPGNITGFDVTIGATTLSFMTSQTGDRAEVVNLSGTSLANMAATMITLSNFTIDAAQFPGMFSISEVTLEMGGPVVPVPAAVWLFGTGLAGLMMGKRKKKTA